MSNQKKNWQDMNRTEKTVGLVAIGFLFVLIIWFVVGTSHTEAPNANDKINNVTQSVIQESQDN